MLNTLLLIIAVVFLAANGVVLYILIRKHSAPKDDTGMTMLNQNIQGMQQRLDKVSEGIHERLDNAARVIGNVNKEIGVMQEIGRNMQALQDFLKSPKLRGNLGEQILEQMLEQCFPRELYACQYKFSGGQIVDAIVHTEDGIIPIDAKFPMENYQRMVQQENDVERDRFLKEFAKDVKKHVNDIAKKYILPDQGTVDFAIMYIPSEAVYYEIIRHDLELNLHGVERRILFVSPNSFYYFLRVIMMGMQGKRVAQATREILASIQGIQRDAERLHEAFGVLNNHMTHAKSAMDRVTIDYTKLEGKIERLDQIDEVKILETEQKSL
jgi:DNA recombination protein RmuC